MKNEDALVLKKGAEILGIQLNEEQMDRFEFFLRELNTWRKGLNLVSREGDWDIIVKDFLDSLTVIRYLPPGCSVADCGSGAGFPGIPIKIVRPDVKVCLLDSARKKVYFLRHLLRGLRLDGIEALWTGGREKLPGAGEFDFVITRAFGSFERIHKSCSALVKSGGILLAMKGKKGSVELETSLPFLKEHGWKRAFVDKMTLPVIGQERILIGIIKTA